MYKERIKMKKSCCYSPRRLIRCLLICALFMAISYHTVLLASVTSLHANAWHDLQHEDSWISMRHSEENLPSKVLVANASVSFTGNRTIASQNISVEDYTSVDFVACCGLGHRLIRMSCAYHIARKIGADLRAFWGWCGGGRAAKEVFSSLFEPDNYFIRRRLSLPTTNISLNFRYSFANEVTDDYREVQRRNVSGTNNSCRCHEDKIASDLEFYSGLVNRYRYREQINAYVSRHFANRTVYGIHIRAGNGEQGDFADKRRGLEQKPEEYVKFVCEHILQHYTSRRPTTSTQAASSMPPPLLYVATDTPTYISLFRTELNNTMPVLDLPQGRVETGVFFGIGAVPSNSTDQCLQRYKDAVTDLILLSHADVVIAGRQTSFVQSLPMSMAFGKDRSKVHPLRNDDVYCEVQGRHHAEKFECYRSYKEWCCGSSSWMNRELVKFRSNNELPLLLPTPKERPQGRTSCRPHRYGGWARKFCLPHDWRVDGF